MHVCLVALTIDLNDGHISSLGVKRGGRLPSVLCSGRLSVNELPANALRGVVGELKVDDFTAWTNPS